MTGLRALEQYDGITASNILASLVMSDTNPGVGEAKQFLKYEQQGREVLAELTASLNLQSVDQSEARARILEALTNQLYALSMEGKDTEAVLARAGTSGRLTPSLYRVEFSPNFQPCVELGTREAHVIDAIAHADDFQHFGGSDGQPSFSIFLKFHSSTDARRAFWLIVYAHRSGRMLFVQNAFRAFLDEIDLSLAREPIEVFGAFAQKFGLEVQAGSQSGRFIFNADVPLEAGKMIKTYTVKGVRDAQFVATMSGYNTGSVHRVVIAYAIDLLRYEKSLNAHGVRTRLVPRPSPSQDELDMMVGHEGSVTRYLWR